MINTDIKIGKAHGVSASTVERAAKTVQAVETLEASAPGTREKFLKGDKGD